MEKNVKKVIFKLQDNFLYLQLEDLFLQNILNENKFVTKDERGLFRIDISVDDIVNFQKVFEPIKTYLEILDFKEVYETDFFILLKTKYAFSHVF